MCKYICSADFNTNATFMHLHGNLPTLHKSIDKALLDISTHWVYLHVISFSKLMHF